MLEIISTASLVAVVMVVVVLVVVVAVLVATCILESQGQSKSLGKGLTQDQKTFYFKSKIDLFD